MRAHVYIDGFNLPYGAVDGTPYRWLNVVELCRRLLPRNQVEKVRYFTALVKDTPSDRTKSARQQMFIRALETLPEIEVTYGSFLANVRRMPLARARPEDAGIQRLVSLQPSGPRSAVVLRTEEKGSDVNLATMLVADAFKGAFEAAAVLSTDSDLALPIELVRRELGLPVGVLFPRGRFSVELDRVAAFRRTFDARFLRACQLPQTIVDSAGRTITKPAAW
jgi:hypothetical protein